MTVPLNASEGLAIRAATAADEPFLWEMLYFAANMAEDQAASAAVAKSHPYLAAYVVGGGRAGDLGVVAVGSGLPLGAAWLRVLHGAHKHYSAAADGIPELALAVRPELIGQGLGTQLRRARLGAARGRYPAIVLSVRAANPAQRLYERLGFVVVDTVVNRVGGRSHVMQIDLG